MKGSVRGRTCRIHERHQRSIQNFGPRDRIADPTWTSQTEVGGCESLIKSEFAGWIKLAENRDELGFIL